LRTGSHELRPENDLHGGQEAAPLSWWFLDSALATPRLSAQKRILLARYRSVFIMTSFRLRTALPSDRDAIVDLIHALNVVEADLTGDRKRDRAAAAAYYDELLQRLSKRNGRIVLAEADGNPVAAMGFSLDEDAAYITDDVRRHGTVTDLIVNDEWRGQGIGRMLLKEAERLTREAGLKRLAIGVLVANEKAERTYRAFGFEPYVSILTKPL
jgi:GNAT superfamily N-acetyltransferase